MSEHPGRYLAIALVLLAGLAIYRHEHPSTTFAADGTDAQWDQAARRCRGRPTVVLFSAAWCPACRSLEENVLTRSDVSAELLHHYSFYVVDLTAPSRAVRAHAQQMRVNAIPLLIRYDANGNETDRTNYLDSDQLIAWLKAGE